jgi:nucleolar protein 56
MRRVRVKWFGVFEGDVFIPVDASPEKRVELLESVVDGDPSPLIEYAGDDVEVVFEHLPVEGEDYGYPPSLLRDILFELGRRRISQGVGVEESIVNAVNAIDELDDAINVLYARLRNWYGLYHPELYDAVDMEEYIGRIAADPFRRGEDSVGVALPPEDLEALSLLARTALTLVEERERLASYLERRMRSAMPSLSEVAGPMLGARLLALSGGLRRLATMPASTVQLLGAEKALFRHLRTGRPPPKHGVIYLHPLVQSATPRERGKVARALAAKIAIAARVDLFGGEPVGKKLREELERRFGRSPR